MHPLLAMIDASVQNALERRRAPSIIELVVAVCIRYGFQLVTAHTRRPPLRMRQTM